MEFPWRRVAGIARRWDVRLLGSPTAIPGHHRGLRKPSAEQIAAARDKTADKIGRITLTLIAWAGFCMLSLLSPDSNLVGGSETLHMPFGGPVSFFGFVLLGPAVLISLRVYLQVYAEHGERLDQLASHMRDVRVPTLLPLRNRLVRWCGRLGFYLMLPLLLGFFAWKAAVFPAWGAGLICVAVAASASHIVLPFGRVPRLWKVLVIVSAMIAAGVAMSWFGLPHRRFSLVRANLSNQLLFGGDFDGANLAFANLTHAYLGGATLTHANLFFANLTHALLIDANLTHANLPYATLTHAMLDGATLTHADLSSANLTHANLAFANLTHADLLGANLTHAILGLATLTHADLVGASLTDANLANATLSFADLSAATLTHADLSSANLTHANLSSANLTHAMLGGANLTHADLNNAALDDADLRGATGLTQAELSKACGIHAKLPKGLTLKPCRRLLGKAALIAQLKRMLRSLRRTTSPRDREAVRNGHLAH